jgi:hypothetical protein
MTSLISFIVVLSLSVSVQAVVITFHTTEPTLGPYDVYNFVGATRDGDNVGTTSIDGATNDATTYVAFDRGSQGQFFVTGDSEPVYQITGFWYQHCGYTENTNQTYWNLTAGNTLTARVTFPPASGTEDFIMRSETYTVTGSEENNFGVGPSANGTGTWVHAVFDTPVPVSPGVEYGIDMTAASGGFYEVLGIKDSAVNGNPYPDGTAYVSGAAGVPSDSYTTAPGDRVFIVELIAQSPLKASAPNPVNAADDVSRSVNLTWVPGLNAAEHDIYFGDNYDNVSGGIESTYQGTVTEPSYNISPLTIGQTYYWRIDEVNGLDTWVGDVWSFTVAPTKTWDPSPYNDEVAVFTEPDTVLSWNPGTEASESRLYFGTSRDSLTLETTISHTGLARYNYSKTGLANDQVYYWRVDEVNDVDTWEGDVWYFTTIPEIQVTDPNLVGWWKFDEGPGKAIDWSGLGQHGTVFGSAQSVLGYDGDAIQLDGFDDIIQLPIGSTIAMSDSITITTWIDFSDEGGTEQRIFDFGNSSEAGYMFLTPDNGTTMNFTINSNDGSVISQINAPHTLPTGWHHVAVSIDSITMILKLYLDGESVASDTTGLLPSELGNTTNNWIGRSQWGAQAYLNASLDDFRIYNYALTAEEIGLVMRIDPLIASNPYPNNGAISDIEVTLPLTWLQGDDAVQHDVYFGIEENAVEDADTSMTDIYRGRQAATSYAPDEGVEWGARYFWRIDEVNSDNSISTGRVWSFTVADYFVVDDFEDYNDYEPDRIFDAWLDGYGTATNGSTVGYAEPDFLAGEHFVETNIVNDGAQSMPYFYDNNMKYSEAVMTLESGHDWTRQEVAVLSLWHIGYPAYSGSFIEDPVGTFTMTGSGVDIWDTTDEFHFAYKQLTGVGSITVRVLSVDNTDPWAKAGVMIRDTLEPGSRNALMVVTPGQGVSFQTRTDTDGASISTTEPGITAPQWVRIERDISGNFTASYSDNGSTWTQLGSNIVNMSATAYVGLAVTSHNTGAVCEAVFSNVTTTGNVTQQQWMNQDVGIISNEAERMYVVLNDSAVVYNENPDASLISEWTEWRIDLQRFADQGVDLTNVDSIGLGFGERNNPQAGGAGTVYLDDIRLYRPMQ